MNRPVFAERLAHHHPYEDDVPFPKRRDSCRHRFFFLTEVRASDQRVIDAPGLF
jgi:hypothetical protein